MCDKALLKLLAKQPLPLFAQLKHRVQREIRNGGTRAGCKGIVEEAQQVIPASYCL